MPKKRKAGSLEFYNGITRKGINGANQSITIYAQADRPFGTALPTEREAMGGPIPQVLLHDDIVQEET